MKWFVPIVASLATLAIAAPAPQQQAAKGVNDKANNGQDVCALQMPTTPITLRMILMLEQGIEAAAKAEAAVLLSDNGDGQFYEFPLYSVLTMFANDCEIQLAPSMRVKISKTLFRRLSIPVMTTTSTH